MIPNIPNWKPLVWHCPLIASVIEQLYEKLPG